MFFRWVFDKNNNRKYWNVVNGENKVCKYGTKAFIDWINNMILLKEVDKPYIINENAKTGDSNNINLLF